MLQYCKQNAILTSINEDNWFHRQSTEKYIRMTTWDHTKGPCSQVSYLQQYWAATA